MAKSNHPNPLERRYLVGRAMQPEKAVRIADAYLEEDRVIEAIDFLRKAEATDRFEALRGDAVSTGDVFLLRQLAAASGAPVTREEWSAVAETAEAAGKERYAVEARRQLDALEA